MIKLPSYIATAILSLGLVDSANANEKAGFAFDEAVTRKGGALPWMLASGDLNGDSKPDIVAANALGSGDTGISLYLNNTAQGGRANFSEQIGLNGELFPEAVAIADMDKDGRNDIVVASVSTNIIAGRVFILKNTTPQGQATPTFKMSGSFELGTVPQAVAVGDLDNDGRMDVVTSNTATLGYRAVSIGLNNFTPGAEKIEFETSHLDGGIFNEGVALGDINKDGKLDITTANVISSDIRTWMSSKTSKRISFHSSESHFPGLAPGGLAVADMNRDAVPDIVCGCALDLFGINGLPVMVNSTEKDSAKTAFKTYSANSGALGTEGVVARDLDGDGDNDLAAGNFWAEKTKTISVVRNLTASPGAEVKMSDPQDLGQGWATQAVIADDFNADGAVDLAATSAFGDAGLSVYVNRTPQIKK